MHIHTWIISMPRYMFSLKHTYIHTHIHTYIAVCELRSSKRCRLQISCSYKHTDKHIRIYLRILRLRATLQQRVSTPDQLFALYYKSQLVSTSQKQHAHPLRLRIYCLKEPYRYVSWRLHGMQVSVGLCTRVGVLGVCGAHM